MPRLGEEHDADGGETGPTSARREWLRAATPSGPRNSSALAVPSGSRTAAAMKSNVVTPAVTTPSAARRQQAAPREARAARPHDQQHDQARPHQAEPAGALGPDVVQMPIAAAMPTWTQLIEATAIAVPGGSGSCSRIQ